jgi:molybdopterin-guanine dinucleotide biosynthesis protein A
MQNHDVTPSISALILAGGKPDDPLAVAQRVAHASLVKIGGKSIIAAMAEAFLAASGIEEVVVIGVPEVAAALPSGVFALDAIGSMPENLAFGMEACQADLLLIAPSDVPWLTPEIVSSLLSAARATHADLTFPIVSKQAYEKRYPGSRRTYVTLREGTFTFANLIVVRKRFMQAQLPLMQTLFENRKHPLALAKLFGFGFVLQFLARRLKLSALEARASQITGGRCAALPIDLPELAFDVDKPEDLEYALRLTPAGQ